MISTHRGVCIANFLRASLSPLPLVLTVHRNDLHPSASFLTFCPAFPQPHAPPPPAPSASSLSKGLSISVALRFSFLRMPVSASYPPTSGTSAPAWLKGLCGPFIRAARIRHIYSALAEQKPLVCEAELAALGIRPHTSIFLGVGVAYACFRGSRRAERRPGCTGCSRGASNGRRRCAERST